MTTHMVNESKSAWIRLALFNPHPKDGEPLTIFSLPQELLQMIMIDTSLGPEDQFALKLASREFSNLNPPWDAFRSQAKLGYRHDTVSRLYRVLPNSYECSGCQVRHSADLFARSEWPKGDQERECTAFTSGVPLFNNIRLTFECVQRSLTASWKSTEKNPEFKLPKYWVMHTKAGSAGVNEDSPVLQVVAKHLEVKAASDLTGLQNSVKFSLGREEAMLYIQSEVEVYLPWMGYFVSAAKDLGGWSSTAEHLMKAWEEHTSRWSFSPCPHFSLSDKKFGNFVYDAIK
ncbi:hypothetical protein MMC10_006530 [Thelotrema lepadinum]|nr:hypothetical protein [Thelotrema lepadinum]